MKTYILFDQATERFGRFTASTAATGFSHDAMRTWLQANRLPVEMLLLAQVYPGCAIWPDLKVGAKPGVAA